MDSLLYKIDPQQWSSSVNKRLTKLEDKLVTKSQKTLRLLQRQEEKIYRRILNGKDSVQARIALVDSRNKYQSLRDKLMDPSFTGNPIQYFPRLDTLSTALKFLSQNGAPGPIKDALNKTQLLQNKFQQAEEIKKFIKERRQQFKEQLERMGFAKQLKKYNKEVYYYSARINQYKELLKDSKKAEKKAIELLSKTKLFRDFMRKNSILASLFPLAGEDPSSFGGALAGLQTRVQVNNLIQQQLSAGGPNAQAQFSQNVQDAQSQLNELKNKVSKFGGSNSDTEFPEGFKPNPQKTKTFFQRIQLNADFQTTRHNKLFPVNSDLGLSAGYKLNSNSTIAIGSSFKIGWGTGFNHIRITSQGFSLRGGIDWRLKGNLFIAGNYEHNYFSAIRNMSQLRDYQNWKPAALLGLSKRYTIKKGKGGEIKLLYDFLYNRQPVRTQPLTIRFGYNLK